MKSPLNHLTSVSPLDQLVGRTLPPQATNLAGKDFGRLRVIAPVESPPSSTQRTVWWSCICSCGAVLTIDGRSLRAGSTKSCGCLHDDVSRQRKLTHGQSKTPTYRSWRSAKDRVSNPNNPRAQHYYHRGITMCDRWLDSFEAFLEDMGERPQGTSLDRIDNNGNYEKSNCRWATPLQQAANQRHRSKQAA